MRQPSGGLEQGLAALPVELTSEQTIQQALVDAMKVPWMAAAPTDVLINEIRERFVDDGSLQNAHGFWGVVSWIKKQFPNIDLTSPPEFSM